MPWKPSCSIETLKARAELLAEVREFFAARDVMEVETPLLMEHGVTDRYMESMRVNGVYKANNDEAGFLQTSPEYAMKRLLCAGSGSIYQVCKAFRLGDSGKKHNPEFTMLEWYRVAFDHKELMNETYDFLSQVLGERKRVDFTYQAVFEQYLSINPFMISESALKEFSQEKLGDLPQDLEFDDYLNLLFEDQIEPNLGKDNSIVFIDDYPASQSALAKIDVDNPKVANRFEVYIDGVELANGFYELQDHAIQLERFEADNQWRLANNKKLIEIDTCLIQALEAGLEECAGIALGLDRLLMVKLGLESIDQILTFPT